MAGTIPLSTPAPAPFPAIRFVTDAMVATVGLLAIDEPPAVAFQSMYWLVRLAAEPVVFWFRIGISAGVSGHGPNVVEAPQVPNT